MKKRRVLLNWRVKIVDRGENVYFQIFNYNSKTKQNLHIQNIYAENLIAHRNGQFKIFFKKIYMKKLKTLVQK